MTAARLLLFALLALPPCARACNDNNGNNPDPEPPWDPSGDGDWGDNGDGSYTDIPPQNGESQGYTPPPPPQVQWLALPPGGWAAGASASIDATATDSAGALAAVLIDQSADGGATWNPLAYAGASGASGESDGSVTAQAGATYQFRAWATDSAGQSSSTLYSSAYPIPSPPSYYLLSVSAVGPGSVSSPGGTYLGGSTLSVTAIPDANGIFQGWSGDVSSTATTASVTLNGSMTLVATFATAQANLTLATVGSGQTSGSGSYPVGSTPAISASPAPHWVFSGWSPAGSVSDPAAASTTAVLSSDLTLTATFTPATATLSTSVLGAGQVSGGGTYALGATATLSAVAGQNDRWIGWSGDVSGSANPVSLTMDGDKQVVATFATLLPQTLSVTVPPTQLTTSPPLSLAVSASSGLPPSLALVSGPAQLSGNVVTFTGAAGTVSLVATQPGNAVYAPAPPLAFSFAVTTSAHSTTLTSQGAASKKNDPKTPATDYQPSHP